MAEKFDKLTEAARKVLNLAQYESRRFMHNYVGTEHILLGLVAEGDGVAAVVLRSMNVELHLARSIVQGNGDRFVIGKADQLTDAAKKVIEYAIREAGELNHHYVGTEHLLLGLLRADDEPTRKLLANLGIEPEATRKLVLHVLAGGSIPGAYGYTDEPKQDVAGQPVSRDFTSSRFDKFTERARKVLNLAQDEAQRFQHNYIGTEHILLGLVREGEGVAARVLINLGVELHKVRGAVEFIIGRGDKVVLGDFGLTPRSKKVIELAIDEARRLTHHYIGTEHLLLGLVREGEGIAAGVLESLGVSLERVRSETIRLLNSVQSRGSERIRGIYDSVPTGSPELRKLLRELETIRRMTNMATDIGRSKLAAELLDQEDALRKRIKELEQAAGDTPSGQRRTQYRPLSARTPGVYDSDSGSNNAYSALQQQMVELINELAQVKVQREAATDNGNLEEANRLREMEESLRANLNTLRQERDRLTSAQVEPPIPDSIRINYSQKLTEPEMLEIGLDREVRRAMNLAFNEAYRLRHQQVGAAHMLAALLNDDDSLLASILVGLDIDLDTIRVEVSKYLLRKQEPSS